jgi:hypothetical protein
VGTVDGIASSAELPALYTPTSGAWLLLIVFARRFFPTLMRIVGRLVELTADDVPGLIELDRYLMGSLSGLACRGVGVVMPFRYRFPRPTTVEKKKTSNKEKEPSAERHAHLT